jgi:predicted RNA-binding protein with PIN domain
MTRQGPVHLLVDGHNVLHLDPELRRLMAEPERARAELERLLAHRQRVTLFYDGGPGGEAQNTRRHGLVIEYSGAADADDRIARWLLFHPNVRAVVVSDDRELRRRIRVLGARGVTARGFLAAFRRQREAPPDAPPLSPGEVDQWLRIFGIEDEADEEPK